MQPIDNDELVKCMVELVKVDKEWTPKAPNCSLYIRPTMIGTNVCILTNMYSVSVCLSIHLSSCACVCSWMYEGIHTMTSAGQLSK